MDREVVDRLNGDAPLGGDRRAEGMVHELYLRFYPGILRFFLKRGYSAESSEDLAQETFLRVFRGMGTLRASETTGRWILRIAVNVWKNDLRDASAQKRGRRPLSLDTLHEDGSAVRENRSALGAAPADALGEAIDRERLTAVGAFVLALPAQMRRCLLLYAVEGFKYREVAAILDLSLEAVKSHIHQARTRLREAFPQPFDEGP